MRCWSWKNWKIWNDALICLFQRNISYVWRTMSVHSTLQSYLIMMNVMKLRRFRESVRSFTEKWEIVECSARVKHISKNFHFHMRHSHHIDSMCHVKYELRLMIWLRFSRAHNHSTLWHARSHDRTQIILNFSQTSSTFKCKIYIACVSHYTSILSAIMKHSLNHRHRLAQQPYQIRQTFSAHLNPF